MGSELSPDGLIDRARSSTGLDDFGSEHFLGFLRAWCEDLASPLLSDVGRARLAKLAVRNLETRLRIEETLRQHPEILDVPIPRVVRIGGFPRSGTTLFHQLMVLGERRRALLRWELVAPLPPPAASTYRTDPRIEQVARGLQPLRGTELERMHWVEADEPEECTWGFVDLSGLIGRGCVRMMPRWADAIYASDRNHRETYVEYRRLIQLLLWRNPMRRDETLVLKSPTDVDRMATFLDVFPEAAAVLVHRDPFRTMLSTIHLQQTINGPYLAEGRSPTDEEYVDLALRLHAALAAPMVDLAQSHPDRVTNVRYPDLMRDPAAVVTEIDEALGLSGDASVTRQLVEQFLARQSAGSRVAPPAQYRDLGITPEMVHGEPTLARYMAAFEIPEERRRVSAPATSSTFNV
ncbi:MAG TPA: sulfotransferase [Mycobacteriales bacterium]|nr:sulfotransferase [Mycobacteriales bacterium]